MALWLVHLSVILFVITSYKTGQIMPGSEEIDTNEHPFKTSYRVFFNDIKYTILVVINDKCQNRCIENVDG